MLGIHDRIEEARATVASRGYWLDVFTPQTWNEFVKAGSSISGFRESRWGHAKKIQKGDYLLCYVAKVKRWVGVLEVTSKAPFKDEKPIWKDDVFPCRVEVKPVVLLDLETAVPIEETKEALSVFTTAKPGASPRGWIAFQASPDRWTQADGETVLGAVLEARKNPIKRPLDPAKLKYRPKMAVASKIGLVTVPESVPGESEEATPSTPKETTAHTEIQYLLLRLGSEMGFEIWVAKNDRGRMYNGVKLGDMPKMKDSLQLNFDKATNATIELIDVLWLKGNAIVKAFEIESTTSIYSGLLRMADLLAVYGNTLNIPLYLVAPEERRDKVMEEVNRPTFKSLDPPLAQACSYLPFQSLRDSFEQAHGLIKYLRPEFIDDLAEECIL